MAKFETVTIGWDAQQQVVTCDKPTINLFFLNEPNAVQWVIESTPPAAVGAEISFQGEAPFTSFGMSVGEGLTSSTKLVASGSKLQRGYSKYTIRFYAAGGTVLAEMDPGIIEHPDPPDWPDEP